jgi:hypothetical protein
MKRHIIQTLFFLLIVTVSSGQELNKFFNEADIFLKTNVVNGLVKYNAIKENPEALKAVLNTAKDISVLESDAMNYQAFWVNAYNLIVIDGIVKNYPLKSPLDVDGFFDKVKHSVGGKMITLNGIENELLRAKFPNEPRFHFVLVCAGLGCPPIINEAYTPKKLVAQLQRQTTKALNDPNFIRVEGKNVNVSQIFEWYKEDFERAGGIVEFINKYKTSKLPEAVQLDYYPYDWTLNSK